MSVFDLSSSASTKPESAPYLRFLGPSSRSDGVVYIKDARNDSQVPVFATKTSTHQKPNLHIARILPNGDQVPFATATFSSSSGTIKISMGGQEITVKTNLNSGSGSKSFLSPQGEMKWKPTMSGTGYELFDQSKAKIAKYKTTSDSGMGEPKLEIFVPLDDSLVDMVVVTAVANHKMEEKEGKQVLKFLRHVAGA
jgi:hypothetical protein